MLSGETGPRGTMSLCSKTIASRSGSGSGKGRKSAASTSEKIAPLAPMPSASVIAAMNVNAGDAFSCRTAKRTSPRNSSSHCVSRISRSLFLPRSTQVRLSWPASPIRASPTSRAVRGSRPLSTNSRVRISMWKASSSSTSASTDTRQSQERKDRFISRFPRRCPSFISECCHRVDSYSPQRGYCARNHRGQYEYRADRRERHRIPPCHAEKNSRHGLRECERKREPNRDAHSNHPGSAPQHEAEHVRRAGPKCDANAKLARALLHGVGQHAEDTNHREDQRQQRKRADQHRAKPRPRGG